MMKQPEIVVAAPVPGPNGGLQMNITNNDRNQILCNSSINNGLLKKEAKKELLKEVFAAKNEILEKSALLDMALQTSLEEHIKLIIPKKKSHINKASNEQLAGMVVSLFEPFEMLHSHLLEQENERNAKISLRRNTANQRKRDSTLVLAESIVELKNKVDNRVCIEKNEEANPFSRGFAKLTPAQRERIFSPQLVPDDPAQQNCLICGHPSINCPEENNAVVAYNAKVEETFNQKLKVWNDYIAANDSKQPNEPKDPFPIDPTNSSKVLKRVPVRGPMKSQLFQCMCSTSKCVSRNSDTCSTCPIKCTDSTTGSRYTFGGTPPSCQCPVCKCTCTAAYFVEDFHKLSIDISIQKANEGKTESELDKSNTNVNAFLNTMFINAKKSMTPTENDIKNNSCCFTKSSLASASKRSADNIDDSQNRYFESMALNIAREGPLLTTPVDRRRLGSEFGASTIVTLPDGNAFNTRVLGHQKDGHAINNNLLGDLSRVSPSTPFPGMTSRLEIDFSQPTDDFIKAACGNSEKDGNAMMVPPSAFKNTNPINLCDDETGDDSNVEDEEVVVVKKDVDWDSKKAAWERLKCRNSKALFLGKSDVTEDELRERKKAKKMGKHLLKNDSKYSGIVDMIGDGLDIESGSFCSQELRNRYADGYMSDEEE